MRNYWLRLGRPDAISWVTLIVVVLVQTSGSFITSLVDYTGRLPDFLLVRVAAFSAMFLVLGLGRLALRIPLRASLKPIIALVAFLGASVAAVYVDDTLLQVMKFTSESRFFNRLGLSLIGLPLAMIVTALIVVGLREYATRNQELRQSAELLITTRVEAESRIAAKKAELVQRIDNEVSRGLSGVTPADSRLTPDEMKTLLDDVIRPLSYQLEREVAVHETVFPVLPRPKISWRDVFTKTVKEGNPFHPIAATAWPTLTSTSFILANFGPVGLVTGAMFFAIYASLTWLARTGWQLIIVRIPTVVRAILLVVIFGITAWAGSLVLMIPENGRLLADNKIVGFIAFMEVVSWTVALLYTANRLLTESTQALVATEDELKREVISLNSAFRQLQRGMSRVLHGPVQQAIAASIHQLQAAPDSTHDLSTQAEVKKRLDAALALITTSEGSAPNLREVFADLTELWAGVATIDIRVSPADLIFLQSDPRSAQEINEIVTEACTNAMKHSEATQVEISIAVNQHERHTMIAVSNDGEPLASDAPAGLGSRLFDDLCLTWKRSQEGPVVVTELVLPVLGPAANN